MSTPEPDLFNPTDKDTRFAEIVLPVPIARLFTYRVPKEWQEQIRVGQRVIVPFGQKKILTGIVVTIHHQPPKDYEAKYVLELLDEHEVIYAPQFQLYQWIADYYLCTMGEVINAALPSGLKLSSESMVQLRPGFDIDDSDFDFSEKERILLARLKSDTLSYSDVSKLLGAKSIYSILKSLSSKEAIILFEQVKEKFKPKTEKHIRINPEHANKKSLESLFEAFATKPKQEAVLLKYLQEVPVFSHPELNQQGIHKSKLMDGDISESSIGTLIKNKVLEEFEVIVPRFGFPDNTHEHPVLLSETQERARNEILKGFEEHTATLLHG
ncbi:MAG: primosomal protein, partial [Bacteroidota bacterium]